MLRHPVSPRGVLLIVLLDLFKVRKMTNFNYDLFKVRPFLMFKNCYKFSKMGIQGEWLILFAWDFRVNAYVYTSMVLFYG